MSVTGKENKVQSGSKGNSIKKVIVIGAGNMGEGMAQNFAQAGMQVKILARHQETLDKCSKQIDENLKLFKEFSLIDEDPSTIKSRIEPVLAANLPDVMENCDFVAETIPEILDEKKKTLALLDSCPCNIIISSNTGSMTIATITQDMKTPERVIGTHYFNPAHIMPLVEIHTSDRTRGDVISTTIDLMHRIGKETVMVRKMVPGFIVNRIQGAIFREIAYLLDEGVATPEDLDTVAKASYGLRFSCIGPMEADDMIGLDTSARVSGNLFKTLSNRVEASAALQAKVQKGEYGIKTGKGWYDYTGKTRTQIMDERNRKLLKQLILFRTSR